MDLKVGIETGGWKLLLLSLLTFVSIRFLIGQFVKSFVFAD